MGNPTQITSLAIPMKSLTAATTLSYSDSGVTFNLNGGTGFAITIPAVKNGISFKFVVGATFGTDYVITAPTGTLNGNLLEAGLVQLCAAKTTLTLEDGVEALGDNLQLRSDGVSWFVTGTFSVANSVTPA